MMVPLKVRRSTIAAQRRGSVKVLVQPENDSFDAVQHWPTAGCRRPKARLLVREHQPVATRTLQDPGVEVHAHCCPGLYFTGGRAVQPNPS